MKKQNPVVPTFLAIIFMMLIGWLGIELPDGVWNKIKDAAGTANFPADPGNAPPQGFVMHSKPIKEAYQARVISVVDGDTIKILKANNTNVNCRMDSIDAPEKAQPFGAQSTAALEQVLSGRLVTIYQTDIDRYGRPTVFVDADGIDVNAWMVANGWAWHYANYSKSQIIGQYEAQARQMNLGLWSIADATPPWEWRMIRR